jgi:hypothetical protein
MTTSGKRLANWALMGGLGLALAACTAQESSYYPAYGTYGGYYPYPPSYYYGPGYGSFGYYNSPFFGPGFSGGSRPSVSQPSQSAPPPSSGGAQGGGGEPRGFLGNVLRQRQNQGQ